MADEEALFTHMQELLDRLPRMQRVGERVRLGRAAAEVAKAAARRDEARRALGRLEESLARTQGLLDAADAAGDARERDRLVRELLFLGDQVGLARGPVNDALYHLGQALQKGGFSDEAQAAAAALQPEELADLEARIASYQEDYNRTLAACWACGQ